MLSTGYASFIIFLTTSMGFDASSLFWSFLFLSFPYKVLLCIGDVFFFLGFSLG